MNKRCMPNACKYCTNAICNEDCMIFERRSRMNEVMENEKEKKDMVKNVYCKFCRHCNDEKFCMVCSNADLFENVVLREPYVGPGLYPKEIYVSSGRSGGKTFAYSKIYEEMKAVKMMFGIVDVIFNDPATIVFWSDGTKTVVKAQDGETFDPEKGLAMAIAKKAFGNKGSYCNVFKKFIKE